MCIIHSFNKNDHLPGARFWEYNNENDGFHFPRAGELEALIMSNSMLGDYFFPSCLSVFSHYSKQTCIVDEIKCF